MLIFMPINAIIHYKTAFEVSSEDMNLMFLLRKEVKNWASKHQTITEYGKIYLNDDWFFKGDNEQHQVGAAYIRTAINIGRYDISNPEHWAFEMIHRDQLISQRLWSINIGLTRVSSQEVRFACVLKYAILDTYIGDMDEPVPSVPNFVKKIVSSKKYICKKSLMNLNLEYKNLENKDIENISKTILYEKRFLPLMFVVEDEFNSVPLDVYKLHIKNIGNVNTYVIKYEDLKDFNRELPYNLNCSPGMVRIYKNFVQNDTGKRHRFYLKEKCKEYSEKVINEITFALSRNANNFKPSEVIEIKHVIGARNTYKLESLRGNLKEDEKLLVKLYEEEIDNIRKEMDEIQQFNDYCLEENGQLHGDLREAKWMVEQYRELREKNKVLEKTIESLRIKFLLPNDLEQCLQLMEKFYSDRIALHNDALKSAKRFNLKNNRDIINEAWEMLMAVANDLYMLKFKKHIPNIQRKFIEMTNIDFSLNESSSTKKNKKLEKTRKCIYNGKEVDLYPHLKSRVDNSFRIYIAFLSDEERILICHCGEHLDNAMTRYIS